jgi:hypothetical protein
MSYIYIHSCQKILFYTSAQSISISYTWNGRGYFHEAFTARTVWKSSSNTWTYHSTEICWVSGSVGNWFYRHSNITCTAYIKYWLVILRMYTFTLRFLVCRLNNKFILFLMYFGRYFFIKSTDATTWKYKENFNVSRAKALRREISFGANHSLGSSSGSTACSSELNDTSNFSLHFPGSCILTNESFVMKARVFEKIYGYFSQIFAVKDAGLIGKWNFCLVSCR